MLKKPTATNSNNEQQAARLVRFGTTAMWLNYGKHGYYFSGQVQFGDFTLEGDDADVLQLTANCPDWMHDDIVSRGKQPKELRVSVKMQDGKRYEKVGAAILKQQQTNNGFTFYRGMVTPEPDLGLLIPSPWFLEVWGASDDGQLTEDLVDPDNKRPCLKGRAACADSFPHGEPVTTWMSDYRAAADSFKKERGYTDNK